jgi:hypothetical protein
MVAKAPVEVGGRAPEFFEALLEDRLEIGQWNAH